MKKNYKFIYHGAKNQLIFFLLKWLYGGIIFKIMKGKLE